MHFFCFKKKKDSVLRKQIPFFFRAATDYFFFSLNSLILKLLDEKGKVRHFHELLSSLPKNGLTDAWERVCNLLYFITFGHLDEINIVVVTRKWEFNLNTDPNTSLNVKGEEEKTLSRTCVRVR